MYQRPRLAALLLALLPFSAVMTVGASAQAQARGTLTRPPSLTSFVEAPYPESESGAAAVVILQIVIAEDGTVADATVHQSASPAFDEAAVAAARQFVFSPAEVDGHPSRIRILYSYQFAERVAAPTTAILQGVVRNREGRVPLAGVTVTLDGTTQSVTDASGVFRFPDIAPGPHAIRLAGERLPEIQTEETLTAGEQLDVVYDVFLSSPEDEADGGDDITMIVTAPAIRREAVSTQVQASEARVMPGTSGDVLRVVENLPGVARNAAGTGQLVVWGAAPQDTRVYVDGVRVPTLYHIGGFRSIVASELVESLDLVPGGYGAAYGRGLGGLVTVRTAMPQGTGFHGSLALNTYDGSMMLRDSTKRGWRFAVAGRGSWLHLFANAVTGPNASFIPIPHYWDGQARVAKEIRPGETIELAYMMGGDRVTRGVPNTDPSLVVQDARSIDFQRVYARWQRDNGNGSRSSVVPWVGWDRQHVAYTYGDLTTSIATQSYLSGVRASHRVRLRDWVDAEVGADAEVSMNSVGRNGSIGLPRRLGDRTPYGYPPPDQIASDAFKVNYVSVAPYVTGDFHVADKVHVIPGLRIDPFIRSVNHRLPVQPGQPPTGITQQTFVAEPRLSILYNPTAHLGFRAAGGIYHQSPLPEDLSASFGNPTLPVSQSKHVLAGVTVKPMDELSIEVTGFASFSNNLATRSLMAFPLPAQALVGEGQGRAYGGQILLRLSPFHHFSGWVSYTLSRSERRDAAGQPWYLFDYDQTHVLTTVASWSPGRGIDVGFRVRYATGMPRTQILTAAMNTYDNTWQPVYGTRNGIRLPAFVQLDLRVSKRWDIGTNKLELYLDLQNATNRQNSEEYVYSQNYTVRNTIKSLPILPIVGAQWTF